MYYYTDLIEAMYMRRFGIKYEPKKPVSDFQVKQENMDIFIPKKGDMIRIGDKDEESRIHAVVREDKNCLYIMDEGQRYGVSKRNEIVERNGMHFIWPHHAD